MSIGSTRHLIVIIFMLFRTSVVLNCCLPKVFGMLVPIQWNLKILVFMLNQLNSWNYYCGVCASCAWKCEYVFKKSVLSNSILRMHIIFNIKVCIFIIQFLSLFTTSEASVFQAKKYWAKHCHETFFIISSLISKTNFT